jgi:hypothetical protein
MKSKMARLVQYHDLFNNQEVFTARNRLSRNRPSLVTSINRTKTRLVFDNEDEKTKYYVEKAKRSVCKCHHPNFISGVCNYRNCFHSEKNHN